MAKRCLQQQRWSFALFYFIYLFIIQDNISFAFLSFRSLLALFSSTLIYIYSSDCHRVALLAASCKQNYIDGRHSIQCVYEFAFFLKAFLLKFFYPPRCRNTPIQQAKGRIIKFRSKLGQFMNKIKF